MPVLPLLACRAPARKAVGVTSIEETVGHNVRELRTASAMSQVDLAEAVGVTRSSISNVEAGRQNITITLLANLADALNVAAADLLRGAKAEERSLFIRLRQAENHARRCDLRVAEAEEAAARAEARMQAERAARLRAEAALLRAELGVEG